MTTAEVAAELRVSLRRVQAMIKSGRLAAHRVGQIWLVRRDGLGSVRRRVAGRPPKGKSGKA